MAGLSKNEQDLLATELMSAGGVTMEKGEFDALYSRLDEAHRAEVDHLLRNAADQASADDSAAPNDEERLSRTADDSLR